MSRARARLLRLRLRVGSRLLLRPGARPALLRLRLRARPRFALEPRLRLSLEAGARLRLSLEPSANLPLGGFRLPPRLRLRLRPRLRVQPRGFETRQRFGARARLLFFLFPSRSFGELGSRRRLLRSPGPLRSLASLAFRATLRLRLGTLALRASRLRRRLRRRLLLADPRFLSQARRLRARLLLGGAPRGRELLGSDHRVALGSRSLRCRLRRLRARARRRRRLRLRARLRLGDELRRLRRREQRASLGALLVARAALFVGGVSLDRFRARRAFSLALGFTFPFPSFRFVARALRRPGRRPRARVRGGEVGIRQGVGGHNHGHPRHRRRLRRREVHVTRARVTSPLLVRVLLRHVNGRRLQPLDPGVSGRRRFQNVGADILLRRQGFLHLAQPGLFPRAVAGGHAVAGHQTRQELGRRGRCGVGQGAGRELRAELRARRALLRALFLGRGVRAELARGQKSREVGARSGRGSAVAGGRRPRRGEGHVARSRRCVSADRRGARSPQTRAAL